MNISQLLQWHYMIFLVPFGIAVLMLLLSSLRIGGHHGSHARVGHSHATHGHAPHGHTTHGHASTAHRSGSATRATRGSGKGETSSPILMGLIGIDRAPLPIVLQSFCLAWGFCGYWANQIFLHDAQPSLRSMLPSLGIAIAGGVIGGRLSAEVFARILPNDESAAISRHALFGLTGKVTFPVTETSGRIHVYDEFGTLHDESCRIAPGHAPITKGCRVLVSDVDPRGQLLVEETTE